MNYSCRENTYFDKDIKARTTVGSFEITRLNAEQYEKVRNVVVEMYNQELELHKNPTSTVGDTR
jgi:hypothetical protein